MPPLHPPPPGRRASSASEADLQKPRDAGMLVEQLRVQGLGFNVKGLGV